MTKVGTQVGTQAERSSQVAVHAAPSRKATAKAKATVAGGLSKVQSTITSMSDKPQAKAKPRASNAKPRADKAEPKAESKSIESKTEGTSGKTKLPPVDRTQREFIGKLYNDVSGIQQADFLTKAVELYNILSGNSKFHGRFVEVRKKVHFLSCFSLLRKDKEQWQTIMNLYKFSVYIPIVGTSYPFRTAIVERFNEYRIQWVSRTTIDQRKVFCEEVRIDQVKGVRFLEEGNLEGLMGLMSSS